ncbi:hypothetical protein LIER_24506 [Lithospermum erythrorhizon]|uniref:PORR domain-containing protein n=1 Tax=Lithospermum erythrorhizon TaxID=34254 RepID=A0AAV3R1G1_LITER
MDVISKYPAIFRVVGGPGVPPMVTLTRKAEQIAASESEAREDMGPLLVKNLRKLLMLSVDCMVPLETIELIRDELGLPGDFKKVLVPKYPHFFTVKDVHGRAHLCLENWDSSLAVTAREERFAEAGGLEPGGHLRKGKISKDGNFSGPFAFRSKSSKESDRGALSGRGDTSLCSRILFSRAIL